MLCLLLALLAPASAQTVTTSVSGGYDTSANELWTGAELALHPRQRHGWAGGLRLAPGYGFTHGYPQLLTETWLTRTFPEDEATLRVGLGARGLALLRRRQLPIEFQVGEATEDEGVLRLGLIPSAFALIELEFDVGVDRAFITGVRGGPGSNTSRLCEQDEFVYCRTWTTGFIGGFYGRWTAGHFNAELQVGTVNQLSIGRAW